MTYRQQLESIIETLNSALSDADKFDNGVDAAGQDNKNNLHNLRLAIQAERNSRKNS
jgi:hypothetical protein